MTKVRGFTAYFGKFTKGKWSICPPAVLYFSFPEIFYSFGDQGFSILAIQGNETHHIGVVDRKDDARLVAADPEMYEELIFAMAALRGGDAYDKKRADMKLF